MTKQNFTSMSLESGLPRTNINTLETNPYK